MRVTREKQIESLARRLCGNEHGPDAVDHLFTPANVAPYVAHTPRGKCHAVQTEHLAPLWHQYMVVAEWALDWMAARDVLVSYVVRNFAMMQPGEAFAVTEARIEDAGFDDGQAATSWVRDLLGGAGADVTLDVTGNIIIARPPSAV